MFNHFMSTIYACKGIQVLHIFSSVSLAPSSRYTLILLISSLKVSSISSNTDDFTYNVPQIFVNIRPESPSECSQSIQTLNLERRVTSKLLIFCDINFQFQNYSSWLEIFNFFCIILPYATWTHNYKLRIIWSNLN